MSCCTELKLLLSQVPSQATANIRDLLEMICESGFFLVFYLIKTIINSATDNNKGRLCKLVYDQNSLHSSFLKHAVWKQN